MAVLRIVVLLAGVVCAILFPLFFGHALSTHESRPIVIGGAALVLGAALIFLSTRIVEKTPSGH